MEETLPYPCSALMDNDVTALETLSNKQVFSDADLDLTSRLYVELEAGPSKRKLAEMK